jgi:hypothetical protein
VWLLNDASRSPDRSKNIRRRIEPRLFLWVRAPRDRSAGAERAVWREHSVLRCSIAVHSESDFDASISFLDRISVTAA